MTRKTKVFIDANIPMYAAGQEHPNRESSIEVLKSISENKIIGVTSAEVMQEILYRYWSINLLKKGLEVFDSFSQIIDDILPVNFNIISEAKNLLVEINHQNIFPRDAIHVATMDHYGISFIATHDKHFKVFKHIKYLSL
ncbi:MAG: type II toxin-antitoxin system VapC family toxin [Actinomycetota bacterium]|nr:type II toxin-antitoxin system VapC family toxin [Actinomycetota bacterium]